MPRNAPRARGRDLSIVVPLFNESGTFDELHRRLTAVLLVLGLASEILYVDATTAVPTARGRHWPRWASAIRVSASSRWQGTTARPRRSRPASTRRLGT